MEDILARIRNNEIPEHAMGALARGMLPLEAETMIEALFLICSRNADLLEDAVGTFEGLPDGIKRTFFENRDIEAEMIAFYLTRFSLPTEVKSVIILNPMTPGEAIAEAAPQLESSLLDQAVNNQVKILEEPAIIDRLLENPNISINQRSKLEEYNRLLLKNEVDSEEELEGKSVKEIEEEAIKDAREFVAAFGKESGPMRMASSEATAKKEEEAPAEPKIKTKAPASEQAEPDKPKKGGSKLSSLTNLSIPQKIQAAIKGDRETRSILIRDSNKLVSCAVIKSPKITEAEIEFYAALRNVQTDVLRMIAQNREWLKNYKIIHTLIKNPRTPLAFTMKLLPRLNKVDLKNLQRDRNVPEVLRKMAKKMSRGQ